MRNITTQTVLALSIPTAFIGLIYTLFFFPPPTGEGLRILDAMVGLIGGWTAMIVGFYFNSSASSQSKDNIIAGHLGAAIADARTSDPDIIAPRPVPARTPAFTPGNPARP